MRNRILLSISCFLIAIAGFCQEQQQALLFEEYAQGTALLKDKSIFKSRYNYNMDTRELFFYEGDKLMLLSDNNTIDTLYVSSRKFIPHKDIFLEMITGSKTVLYVDWKTDVFSKGKKGAFGTTSHGSSVEQANAIHFEKLEDISVYVFKAENSYYLKEGNKLRKFNDLKSFLKLFPKTEEQTIRDFVKEKNTDWQKPADVLIVADQFSK